MSQENVDAVRRSLEAWNRGDVDAWLEAAHPDLEFRTSGVYPGTAPVYRGHAELRRYWTTFREPWEAIEIRLDRTHEVGDEIVALATFDARGRDGISVQREVAWIWRFADHLCTRVKTYGTWREALQAAGLGD